LVVGASRSCRRKRSCSYRGQWADFNLQAGRLRRVADRGCRHCRREGGGHRRRSLVRGRRCSRSAAERTAARNAPRHAGAFRVVRNRGRNRKRLGLIDAWRAARRQRHADGRHRRAIASGQAQCEQT